MNYHATFWAGIFSSPSPTKRLKGAKPFFEAILAKDMPTRCSSNPSSPSPTNNSITDNNHSHMGIRQARVTDWTIQMFCILENMGRSHGGILKTVKKNSAPLRRTSFRPEEFCLAPSERYSHRALCDFPSLRTRMVNIYSVSGPSTRNLNKEVHLPS